MENRPKIIFVCEHGAAKSIVAAAYFNRLAAEMRSDLRAVARGTNPDRELAPQAIKGLSDDGLTSTETVPQFLTEEDLQSAELVIAFCELPADYNQQTVIEHWKDVPPVSENYETARDVIIEYIRKMLKT